MIGRNCDTEINTASSSHSWRSDKLKPSPVKFCQSESGKKSVSDQMTNTVLQGQGLWCVTITSNTTLICHGCTVIVMSNIIRTTMTLVCCYIKHNSRVTGTSFLLWICMLQARIKFDHWHQPTSCTHGSTKELWAFYYWKMCAILIENYMMHQKMQCNHNFEMFLHTARMCNCMVCFSKLFSQNTFLCHAMN